MKTKKILLGLPLALALTMSGCSGGETPSLPNSDTQSNTAPSNNETNKAGDSSTPTTDSSPSPSADNGNGDTKDNPQSSEPAKDPTAKPGDPDYIPEGVKPLDWSTEPTTLEAPVYLDAPETQPLSKPASADDAFATYTAFYSALKEENWDKACSFIDVHPSKGKEFCINWYKEFKSDTSLTPKIEDYAIAEETISHDIVMTRKEGNKTSREYIKVKNIDGKWKIYNSVMAAS